MEEIKKKSGAELNEKDIVYSKAIKAGKRIYYVDVKKNRKGEMFLAVTESKKIITGEGDDMQVSFEKHKIFLYREDFEKFLSGLKDTMDYICDNQPDTDYYDQKKDNETSNSDETAPSLIEPKKDDSEEDGKEEANKDGDIKIDIDFD